MNWPEWTSPDGRIRLINADCLEVLPHIETDAVVTDPPYGIDYVASVPSRLNSTGNVNLGSIAGDSQPFDPSPWIRWPCILWGANHYSQRLPHGRWLAWNKLGGMEPWDQFSDVEFAWQNKRGADKIFSHLWKGLCQEGAGEKRRHPTQKPIALMEWCLSFVKDAETILDPFAGYCTTAIACIRTDRRCICIEKEPKYWQISIDRCKREYGRTVLFNEQEAVA